MKIQHILATTDFSNESIVGVRYAASFAEKVGSAVALLHVVELPTPPPMPGMRTVMRSLQDPKIAKRARARLNALALQESKSNLKVEPLLRSGKAVSAIIAAARKLRTDLIVMSTHGHSGARRVLLGSTAERVVRHAPCSVLTVSVRESPVQAGEIAPVTPEKILVPIDFSNASENVLPWAASLATQFNAEMVLMHVVEKFPIDYVLGQESINDSIAPLMKQGEAALKTIAADLKKSTGHVPAALVREGTPFAEICSAAERLSADLIVLTTHGRTGLRRLWLGSTAERVVRHASCPVLVVRNLESKA